MSVSTIEGFLADLLAAPTRAVKRGRGVGAKHLDRAAATAKQDALASWSKYGRGESGSAGTIRARMSRDKSQVAGYVLADGQGAFQSEHGTSSRAPKPVMFQAVDGVADGFADDLADMIADLF